MPVKSMKLYVWEEVLYDYTAGMIVVLAPDLDAAMAAVDDGFVRADMGAKTPTIIDLAAADVKPQAWWVYGGS